MKKKRDLKQLVELMKAHEDNALICLGVRRSTFDRKIIIWQGMQSRVFYEETADMVFCTQEDYFVDFVGYSGAVCFYNLVEYSEIESEVFEEFLSEFPLLRLMIRNNDQVMVLLDYFENENVRLWIGSNTRKFYLETSSVAYKEDNFEFEKLSKKLKIVFS